MGLSACASDFGEGVWGFENPPFVTGGDTVPGEGSVEAEEGHLRTEWMWDWGEMEEEEETEGSEVGIGIWIWCGQLISCCLRH